MFLSENQKLPGIRSRIVRTRWRYAKSV